MKLFSFTAFAVATFCFLQTNGVRSHGLIEFPPARNWLCGFLNPPHEVENGVADLPQCGEAYETNFYTGYHFMSVLTHGAGRAGVSPLPENVCGFNSETWNGGATPWDTPMDWPVNHISSGRNEFKWNIFWGPHWGDTEEFRYYITKEDFEFDATKVLDWSDFEDEAFCTLSYNDQDPTGNSDVVKIQDRSWFLTFCNVPARSGHHVIYGTFLRS